MMRKLFVGISIVVLVAAVLGAVKYLQIKAMLGSADMFAPPPETIAVAVASEEAWPDTLTAVGSVSPAQGVMVSPEVAGTVSEIDFESGATVKQGDLLIRLDTSSEEAQLRAA